MTSGPSQQRILVIGHINHDRIWRLNEPLRSGARIAWHQRMTRLGGGGYFTARRLLDYGHRVALLSNLMNDDHGQSALDHLDSAGFDTGLITIHDGQTDFADILLDPFGERTILSNEKRMARSFHLDKATEAQAVYINGPHISEAITKMLVQTPLVVSQFPLRNADPRPADIFVGSMADLPGRTAIELWQEANRLSHERLRYLIMTDGPDPTLVHDGIETQYIPVPRYITVRDTIGAGDSFSGALIHELLQGKDITTAIHYASLSTAEWLADREGGTSGSSRYS